jgi:hypothetical protein
VISRNDSTDIRTLKSQQFAAEVAADRSQQLADKFLQKVAAMAREQRYHNLWEAERIKRSRTKERAGAKNRRRIQSANARFAA